MRLRSAMLALALGLTSVHAQEAQQGPGPDLDFLEYLGAWAEDDDEWLAIEEWENDNGTEAEEDRPGDDPKGSDRQEDDDDESD